MSVLTDMVGNRSYVACLSFFEPFTLVKKAEDFDSIGDITSLNISADSSSGSYELKQDVQMEAYYPKCLCLVSRFTYFDILKVCTGLKISFTGPSDKMPDDFESDIMYEDNNKHNDNIGTSCFLVLRGKS